MSLACRTVGDLGVQEVFHVYLNKFEIAVSHLLLIIFSNNIFTIGKSDLQECAVTKKIAFNFIL